MLDGQDSTLWWERIRVLGNKLDELPRSLPVHLELASMANTKLVKAIVSQVNSTEEKQIFCSPP